MAPERSREGARTKTRMEMTPMIDVTFLLLIFFLCTLQFRILEAKIPAYLPRDVGVNPTPVEREMEKIRIDLARLIQPSAAATGRRADWKWHEQQIRIQIGHRHYPTLRDLHDTLRRTRDAHPEARAVVRPASGTLYIDAIKVLNECVRAGFLNVTLGEFPEE